MSGENERCTVLPNGQGPACDWDPDCEDCLRRSGYTTLCPGCGGPIENGPHGLNQGFGGCC